MDYYQILTYLFSQLAMYQKVGAHAYKPGLDNTLTICKLLGNPENKFKSVHIAGTNGKGSVSHMLSAILQSAGYKVGLYTSPHLKDFRERIKINGKMISKKQVMTFFGKHKRDFEKMKPSFFEWSTGLAFDYFAKEKVDIAIIETGLGGRLDSTNVITPLLSIITNISYDHQNLLGNTLEKIAYEKAGIIKQNGIVVIGEKQKETKNVFEIKSKEMNALLLYSEDHASAKGISCGLKGIYQQKNIPTVLLASGILNELGYEINSKSVARGLKDVCKLTGLRGRWDVLSKKPLIIADIAHNEAGIREVFRQVKTIKSRQMRGSSAKPGYRNLRIVFGTVNDKDIQKILSLLPKKAIYYFCKADIPRALDENILADKAKKIGLKGKTFGSVKQALNSAKKNASKNDLILVTGSAFVVAEVI
jgi:dihydrofolate synthase/folylpolyglutamate synthase